MDDFFLRPEQRRPERFAEPGGNVDRERFAAEVLVHTGPAFDQLPPGIKIMLDAACLQHLQSCVHMTGNTDTGINIFIQLRRVDI